MVADVNQSYGPWIAPLNRMYDALKCRSTDGQTRGLIILEFQ